MTARNEQPKIECKGERSFCRVWTTAGERKSISLGQRDSPEALAKYDRLCAATDANDGLLPDELLPHFQTYKVAGKKKTQKKPTTKKTRKKSKNTNPKSPLQQMRKVAELKPHPRNAHIYNDTPDAEFIESIRAHGVLDPIVITADGLILSGHRRWRAAQIVGLVEAPVLVRNLSDELDLLEALVEYNRQRKKTNEQLAREAKALMEVERERARRRQATSTGGTNPQLVDSVPQAEDTGKARDKAGAKLGISGKTADRAVVVVERIDALKEEGKEQEAEQLRLSLNERGVAPAYEAAKTQVEAAITSKPQSQPDPKSESKPESKPSPLPPKYPHSDVLMEWVQLVMGQTHVIRVERGGIKAILSEREKWNEQDVFTGILPGLDDILKVAAEFKEEIGRAFKQV